MTRNELEWMVDSITDKIHVKIKLKPIKFSA